MNLLENFTKQDIQTLFISKNVYECALKKQCVIKGFVLIILKIFVYFLNIKVMTFNLPNKLLRVFHNK